MPTWSAHYIADAGFHAAVADFVEREARAVEHGIDVLTEMGPFKKGLGGLPHGHG